jgi:hypothetical protein
MRTPSAFAATIAPDAAKIVSARHAVPVDVPSDDASLRLESNDTVPPDEIASSRIRAAVTPARPDVRIAGDDVVTGTGATAGTVTTTGVAAGVMSRTAGTRR